MGLRSAWPTNRILTPQRGRGNDKKGTEQWCIPPKEDAEFCRHMEDALGVYTHPFDPKRPQICFDERPVQLPADVREPLLPRPVTPEQPGIPAHEDYEHERKGRSTTCSGTSLCRASGTRR
ncbi:MAG TPA: hypothetical protein VF898_05000 [Chloroflexota bacterium]